MNQTSEPLHAERPFVPSPPPTSLQWAYVVCCLLILVGGAVLWQDRFGTQHLAIHLTALGLTAGWFLLPGTRVPAISEPTALAAGPLDADRQHVRREASADGSLKVTSSFAQRLAQLGLQASFRPGWIGLTLTLGIMTGVTRFVGFRLTGQGGLALYEAEFVRYFTGEHLAEALPRAAVFLLVLYLSVLIPGLLFCGIIQETLRRGGYFVCGLLFQAATFGFIHSWMTGSFDPVYGSETFVGAIVYGLLFQAVRDVYIPSLFFWAHVATATLLLAW